MFDWFAAAVGVLIVVVLACIVVIVMRWAYFAVTGR